MGMADPRPSFRDMEQTAVYKVKLPPALCKNCGHGKYTEHNSHGLCLVEGCQCTDAEAVELLEGTKYDDDKTRYDLLSPEYLDGVSQVLTFGAKKYDDWNWAQGIKYGRVFGALMRHLWAFWRGEKLDKETNLPHLWHAGCCLMFLTHYEAHNEQYKEFDDRFIHKLRD
jgi:dATP/dGTP diphosphohydrolase, N-terminal